MTSERLSNLTTYRQLNLFTAATHAQGTPGLDRQQPAQVPICPDISLPWSDDAGPGGWSAKMFLHQLSIISRQRWTPLDTESLLSGSTVLRLRASPARESSLLGCVKPPGKAFGNSFLTPSQVEYVVKRHCLREKLLHVLLCVQDVRGLLVSCSFGNPRGGGRWIAKNASGSPASLPGGLRDLVESVVRDLQAMP